MDLNSIKEAIKEIEQSNSNSDCSISSEAYKRIVKLTAYSDRSVYYIRQRLSEEGFEDLDIETAIDHAITTRILDDGRFAEALIRKRLATKKGLSGCRAELAKHNIDIEQIHYWQEIRADYDSSIELQRALKVLESSYFSSKNIRESAYRKLINRGYGASIATSAARLYSENYDSE